MSEIHFTKEQEKVLCARSHNVLVSAAAGSGKTAVLVERIIRMITEGEHPMDIDRLLVVTFTRAAAAQMRERIGAAISKRLLKDPSNRHLQKQETLLHHAQITTIDSFCTFLLRNHFSAIGLDPSFRQIDEMESIVIEQDTMEQFLEIVHGVHEGKPEETKDEESDTPEEDETKQAAFQEIFEDPAVAVSDAEFRECLQVFVRGTNDQDLMNLLFFLYRASSAHADGEGWLEERSHDYEVRDAEDLAETLWFRRILSGTMEHLLNLLSSYEEMEDLCRDSAGPGAYLGNLADDAGSLFLIPFHAADLDEARDAILKEKTFVDRYQKGEGPKHLLTLYETLRNATGITFSRLASLRGKAKEAVDPDLADRVKNGRDAAKKLLARLHDTYFVFPAELEVTHMQTMAGPLKTLCRLAMQYLRMLRAAKKKQNVIDFTDLERLALRILLTKKEDGTLEETSVALSLRSYYDEVLIDEYQDSNEVQELLLGTIAGDLEKDGTKRRYARFMVGDVKQSIYRFRNARPDIFIRKFETYKEDDPKTERIDLDKNFRSRPEVLDAVNEVFARIMRPEVGNVAYDEKAALKCGRGTDTFTGTKDDPYRTELLLVETEGDDDGNVDAASPDTDDESEAPARKEREVHAIAHRIKELLGFTDGGAGKLLVPDGNGGFRDPKYSDVVLLFRSQVSFGDVVQNVFDEEGIPVYIEQKSGYFSAEEIRQVIACLRVIDNPRQDIPLYGMMRGYFGGFSLEEIEQIRNGAFAGIDQMGLWNGVLRMARREDGSDLARKCLEFEEKVESWRRLAQTMPIHDLLENLIRETKYDAYVAALPSGEQRSANLEVLIEKAKAFEQTSYTGLFRFLRYLDSMERGSVDAGEASVLDENANVVRVMTIHKSKGLEFPITFVSGLATKYAFGRDSKGRLIEDTDLGLGCNYVELDTSSEEGTLRRQAVADQIRRESLGEELRVLYVAMTRAKEKLILTANVDSAAEKIEKRQANFPGTDPNGYLPATRIEDSASCLDLILDSLLANGTSSVIDVKPVPVADQVIFRVKNQMGLNDRWNELAKIGRETGSLQDLSLPSLGETFEKRFSGQYPHQDLDGLYTVTTVTELKEAAYEREQDALEETAPEGARQAFPERRKHDVIRPCFVQEEGKTPKLTAAERGTAIHRAMELWNFKTASVSAEDISASVNRWLAEKKITDSQAGVMEPSLFLPFFETDLARRMEEADRRGKLLREQVFVYGVPARRLNAGFPESETVLVQGIVDALFLETGADGEPYAVLVDYKTDKVKEAKELVEKYRVQLAIYAEAMESILKVKVREKIIYSFGLNSPIYLKE